MKKTILIACLVLFYGGGFAQDQLLMDGNASLREISGSFNKVAVSSNIKLILSQGDPIALAVSASSDKFKDDIKTVVKDGVLNIFIDGNMKWGNSRSRNNTVYLSFKNLTLIKASEAAEIIALGTLSLQKAQVALSGASKFTAAFKAGQLEFDLSGASKATCKGAVEELIISCSGASDMNGNALTAEKATLEASGASDISVSVNKEVYIEASGASHINYHGKPALLKVKASGVSKINNQ
jgi:Putative auto-transporter adhesin, head GIN domain